VRRLLSSGGLLAIAACIPGLLLLGRALADEPAPLRLCADPDNLPFSSANATTPGFYIELGREIARAISRPLQPVWVPTYYTKRQVRLKLLAGQCDGFAGVPDDASFMGQRLIFSQPIIRLGYALVAPPAMDLTKVDGLHGHRVAVQWSTPPQNLLADWADVQTVTALSPEEAMQDLAEGKADAAFIWGASAGWLNISTLHGAYRVVPVEGEHMQWGAAIAFPRDRTELRDAVDHALAGLAPTINALNARYGFLGSALPKADASQTGDAASPVNLQSPGEAPAGRRIFNTTCAHCHGHDAVQGEQRRNLRMLRQRYGDAMAQTFMFTVTHGRISKGMPNWSGIFSDDEFHQILAFLDTVQEPESEGTTLQTNR
jgi:ABC-type amino acid transport substrate-binding protein